jgi:hypothetical protein
MKIEIVGAGIKKSRDAQMALSAKTRISQLSSQHTLHNFINIDAPLATARSL